LGRGLGWGIPRGPFQPPTFCDSVNSGTGTYWGTGSAPELGNWDSTLTRVADHGCLRSRRVLGRETQRGDHRDSPAPGSREERPKAPFRYGSHVLQHFVLGFDLRHHVSQQFGLLLAVMEEKIKKKMVWCPPFQLPSACREGELGHGLLAELGAGDPHPQLRVPLRPEPCPPGTHLYREEASWAAMGTSLANISGPVTAGSVGLTGRAFTNGAPGRGEDTARA